MYMLDLQSSRTPRSAACATEHHEPVVSGGEVALAKADTARRATETGESARGRDDHT
jgi:hypothetical protein